MIRGEFRQLHGRRQPHRVPHTLTSGSTLDYSINYIDDISLFPITTKNMVVTDATVVNALSVDRDQVDVVVYPNPTTGNLYIDAVGIQKVECYNQMGQLVRVYDNVRNSIDLKPVRGSLYPPHHGSAGRDRVQGGETLIRN